MFPPSCGLDGKPARLSRKSPATRRSRGWISEPRTPVSGCCGTLTDHLNSVRLVLDASGAMLDQIAYDAFGNIVARLNPLVDHPLLFTSREFDAETGLYYNRARYLDPSTGRWTTQDPLGFAAGDANLYRYVGNRADAGWSIRAATSLGSWLSHWL
jgi:RHS repeat-associated protein